MVCFVSYFWFFTHLFIFVKKIIISTLERVYYSFVFLLLLQLFTSRRKLVNVWILLSNAFVYSSVPSRSFINKFILPFSSLPRPVCSSLTHFLHPLGTSVWSSLFTSVLQSGCWAPCPSLKKKKKAFGVFLYRPLIFSTPDIWLWIPTINGSESNQK